MQLMDHSEAIINIQQHKDAAWHACLAKDWQLAKLEALQIEHYAKELYDSIRNSQRDPR